MPKGNKLRGDWTNILPQESTKNKQPKIETSPWRCRYCKTDLVRFKLPSSLRRHVSTKHCLLKKGDIRDFEPPSAKSGFLLSFATRKEWSDMKKAAKSPAPVRMSGQTQREKASKKNRTRISKMLWPELIEEYHQDISAGKKVFIRNHPEMKNHQQCISRWTGILISDAKKNASTA